MGGLEGVVQEAGAEVGVRLPWREPGPWLAQWPEPSSPRTQQRHS